MKKDRIIVRATEDIRYISLDIPAHDTVAGVRITPTHIPKGALVAKYRHETLLDARKRVAEKAVRPSINAGKAEYYTP